MRESRKAWFKDEPTIMNGKKFTPIGFIGKDILAVEKEVKPVIEDSRAYREELAQEFRQAIDAVASRQEKVLHRIDREANTLSVWTGTCDWCGENALAANRYAIVDRQLMCGPCINEYGLVEGRNYER